MSDVEKMDIWTVVRTILEKNPDIKAKELIKKVRGKTGLSRSTIYEHLHSFALRGQIYREKGHYFLEKPRKMQRQSETSEFLRSLFPQFWKERDEVQELCSAGMVFEAYEKTLQFAGTLPAASQKRLALQFKEIEEKRAEIRDKLVYLVNPLGGRGPVLIHDPDREKKERALLLRTIPHLWEQIATILHKL